MTSPCANYDPALLNEAIIPTELQNKTKDEQCAILNVNIPLRSQLIMLNNASQNAKRQRAVGRTVCSFKVPWSFPDAYQVPAPVCLSQYSLSQLADYLPTHSTGLSQSVNLALTIEQKNQLRGSYRQTGLYWCGSNC